MEIDQRIFTGRSDISLCHGELVVEPVGIEPPEVEGQSSQSQASHYIFRLSMKCLEFMTKSQEQVVYLDDKHMKRGNRVLSMQLYQHWFHSFLTI